MEKLLLVDDSPSILELMRQALSQAEYEVLSTTDSREASRHLREETFDLLVTDLFMPDQDGFETIVEARKVQPSIRIIAISSNHLLSDQLSVARKLGANHCLPKPFTTEALLHTVRETLRSRPKPSTFT